MRAEAIKSLFSAIREMHQRNQVAYTAYGNEKLGITESALLQEVLGHLEGITAVELGRALALSPVKISRLVKTMSNEGLIERSLKSGRLIISATETGRSLFYESYQKAQKIFSNAFARVPNEYRVEFCFTLSKLCDRMKAPIASHLPEDPPLMPEIRRLTRVCGFLARNTFGSGRSPLEWHVLNLVKDQHNNHSCASLATFLGVFHTTMSTVLSRLEDENLIIRRLSENDARERIITINSAGRAEIDRIEQYGVQLLSSGVSEFTDEIVIRFAETFNLYAGLQATQRTISLGNSIILTRIGDSDLSRARSFVIEERFKQQLLSAVPSSLLNENHPTFAIQKGEELLAVFEFSSELESSQLNLVQGIASPKNSDLKPELIREAYLNMLDLLTNHDGVDINQEVSLNPQQLSPSIIAALANQK